MNMNLQNLRNFKETFTTLKEIDTCSIGSDKFLLFYEDSMKVVDSITFMNMGGVKYMAVLVCTIWNNMGYGNKRMKLMGMFDEDFNLTTKIPLSNGRYLVDVKFTTYRGSYYNEYKPIFVVEGTDIEKKELEVEDEESKHYPTDFLTLYQKALEL